MIFTTKIHSFGSTEKTSQHMVDLWSARINQSSEDDEDDEKYFSFSDDDSKGSDEEFFTPPQSPRCSDSDDEDILMFEESLENFEDEKGFSLFIEG